MARVVVHLDMSHICRLLDAINFPYVDAVAENVGVLAHLLRVTLEVYCINFIISNECLKELDV